MRYIQELLGHSKPETTMIYTHVAKHTSLAIESPLDTALREQTSDKNTSTGFRGIGKKDPPKNH
jgi:site-specific recombinase XerD